MPFINVENLERVLDLRFHLHFWIFDGGSTTHGNQFSIFAYICHIYDLVYYIYIIELISFFNLFNIKYIFSIYVVQTIRNSA